MNEQPVIPDIYSDSVRLSVNPYGMAIAFSVLDPFGVNDPAIQTQPRAIVRMSLEHAKAMTILLRHHLREYEKATDREIPLPEGLIASLGADEKEWRGGGAS